MKELFKGVSKVAVCLSLILSLLYGVLNGIVERTAMRVVDNIGISSDKFSEFILMLIILIIGFQLSDCISDISGSIIQVFVQNNTYTSYFEKLYRIKPSIIKSANSGYISGLVNQLMVHRDNLIKSIVISLPCQVIFMLYVFYVFLRVDLVVGITGIVMVTTVIIIKFIMQNTVCKRLALDASKIDGIRNKMFTDAISNIGTVQKMYAYDFFLYKTKGICRDAIIINSKYAIVTEFTSSLCRYVTFLVVPIAFMELYLSGRIDVLPLSDIAVISSLGCKLPWNIKEVVNVFNKYARYSATMKKLEDICKDDNIREDVLSSDFETLTIKDVEYSYTNMNTGNPVTIKIPYFECNKGDFICICGESGQGKTTLLNIMSGEIETGKVVVNNNPEKKRLDCVFVSQDTEMFDMSIRDNILLDKCEDPTYVSRMMYCLNEVGMGEWISKQLDGIDTIIGERGVFISTGQRQRLNLVRGLLCDNKEVYILDEPTSNVDVETEKRMINLIKDYLKDKTVICVTHRPRILELATKKYTFSNNTLSLDN